MIILKFIGIALFCAAISGIIVWIFMTLFIKSKSKNPYLTNKQQSELVREVRMKRLGDRLDKMLEKDTEIKKPAAEIDKLNDLLK